MIRIILLCLLLLTNSAAVQSKENDWYAGAGMGFNHTDTEEFNVSTKKYAVTAGYRLQDWLFIEAELGKLAEQSASYCNRFQLTNPCTVLKQKYNYAFAGLRAEKFVMRSFGFTGRIGIARANHSTNLTTDNNKTNFSSAIGLVWKVANTSQIRLELQQINFALANERDENAISSNLVFVMAF